MNPYNQPIFLSDYLKIVSNHFKIVSETLTLRNNHSKTVNNHSKSDHFINCKWSFQNKSVILCYFKIVSDHFN